jgi:hypothetical protein
MKDKRKDDTNIDLSRTLSSLCDKKFSKHDIDRALQHSNSNPEMIKILEDIVKELGIKRELTHVLRDSNCRLKETIVNVAQKRRKSIAEQSPVPMPVKVIRKTSIDDSVSSARRKTIDECVPDFVRMIEQGQHVRPPVNLPSLQELEKLKYNFNQLVLDRKRKSVSLQGTQ